MKKFVLFLAAFCGLGVAAIAFFLMFNDMPGFLGMPDVETARIGSNEVIVTSDCWIDCVTKVGFRKTGASFRKIWTHPSDTQVTPELLVRASTDGAIIAITDRPKGFVQWNNLVTGNSGAATKGKEDAFSRQTNLLLQEHGGAIELHFQRHTLRGWKWQDRDFKDFLIQ